MSILVYMKYWTIGFDRGTIILEGNSSQPFKSETWNDQIIGIIKTKTCIIEKQFQCKI